MTLTLPKPNLTPTPPGKPDPRPTPPTPPYIPHTTADDLPKIIVGRVEESDYVRANYWRKKEKILNHCIVAMALRRMFPYFPVSRISVALSTVTMDGRYYQITEGSKGISDWDFSTLTHKSPGYFDFRLEEYGYNR